MNTGGGLGVRRDGSLNLKVLDLELELTQVESQRFGRIMTGNFEEMPYRV